MDKIRYFIKEGLKNIWVNRMMSLASVSVLTVCLLLLGTSLLVSFNVKILIRKMESQNQVGVYLKDNLDQTAVAQVEKQIKENPNVQDCVFISKTQALENEKKRFGQNAALLKGYENDNPYPNSYQVSLKRMDEYSKTVKQLSAISGVENVEQHVEVANKLSNISRVIGIVGLWLFAILAVVSLFIISNTIKLAVYVRKREVNIMKFVGATDGFIRWPFVIEGLLMGILSGGIALLLQWYIYDGLVKRFFATLRIIQPITFTSMAGYMGAGFAAAGILMGVLGSLLSMRKYLKV